ncbi:MAG: hypothetical protein QG635_1315 [Bacteroidota bacterium]|nr:hypothetical protein [Bacteroidota bacterium]
MLIEKFKTKFGFLTKLSVGNRTDLRFEDKLLRVSVLLAFAFSACSAVLNYFTQQNYWVNFFGVISALLYLILIIIIQFWYKYNIIFYNLFVMTLFSVFLAWKYFDGIDGSAFILLIMLNCFYSMLTKGLHSYIVLFSSITLVTILCIVEYNEPEIVLYYRDQSAKFFDISVTVVLAIITIFFTFKYILLKYLEREKVHEQNILLDEKNQIISEQNKKLNEYNATKDKIISVIAHDLRSPLGSFMRITEQMSLNDDFFTDEERKKLLSLMKDSSNNIYSMLENLLEWSMFQQGKINFSPVKSNIIRIVEDSIKTYKQAAAYKNIQIYNNIRESYFIKVDVNMMNSILRNLISNAIKFTPEFGRVDIYLSIDDNNYIFSVKDTGVGIPLENIYKLFRIDSSKSTIGTYQEKGTGFGLILSREFIELHNGHIWAESEVGSAFYFTIPRINSF